MAHLPEADLATLRQISTWITTGVTLDLESAPQPADYNNTPSVLLNADLVRARLREYIDFGAVIPLPLDTHCPFGVQPLHVIIKPDKKPRLVIDLSRNLNDHLRYEYFSYSSVRDAAELSTPGCWYGKLDLSNCFLSFPLHPSAQPHFIFRFDGRLYQFVRMPFGLASAPRVCTLLLSVVAYKLTVSGIQRLIRYLDDFLFVADSREAMAAILHAAQQLFSDFGLVVNTDKTEGPAQQISFLGIQLDSVAQTLSCTATRLTEIRSLLGSALSSHKIRLSFLASLIGKLQFAATVLPGARPFVRRMLDLHQRHNYRIHNNAARPFAAASSTADRRLHFTLQRSSIQTDKGFRADARFWLTHLHQWNGNAKWRSAQATPFCIASDASFNGFGFYLESTPPHVDTSHWPPGLKVGSGYSGVYSPAHSHLHTASSQMTWCEMFAVYAALLTYRSVLRHSCVLFFVDNETDVHIINRQATRSARLAGLLREIYSVSLADNISIYARHRSGVDNVLADFLSRPELHQHEHIVARWQHTHPQMAHHLTRVSIVSSNDFIRPQVLPACASTSPTRSAPTHNGRTPRSSARSSPYAGSSASTMRRHSPSSTSAPSSACTPARTSAPPLAASYQRSPTSPTRSDTASCHAARLSGDSCKASTTSTPIKSSNPRRPSLSPTSSPSTASSTTPHSRGPGTGAPAHWPSSLCSASTSTPTVGCNTNTSASQLQA